MTLIYYLNHKLLTLNPNSGMMFSDLELSVELSTKQMLKSMDKKKLKTKVPYGLNEAE